MSHRRIGRSSPLKGAQAASSEHLLRRADHEDCCSAFGGERSALDKAPMNLSSANISHVQDLDLEVSAGAVWTRITKWPECIHELVDQHTEEIGGRHGVARRSRATGFYR